MSESDGGRPLSRRELRLREVATTGVEPVEPAPKAPEPVAPAAAVEPEISPFHPDGTPRTRREMRELRELALAEMGDLELEQTQAFTREDFEEALRGHEPEAEVDATAAMVATVAAEDESDAVVPDQELEAAGEVIVAEAEPQGYSFPDIAPLDESASVFDDPAVRAAARSDSGPVGGGDFDELISRAVAQEGAAGTTNASALILPDMGHTGQLGGPIGETGELFITGSIDLPKSLGETGGHAALLDSVQGDPDDLNLGEHPTHEDTSIAPVSAARAVSARAATTSVVAAPEKEKSKLPLVLIATGGGLLVIIAGLAAWAVTSGFFA